MKMKFLFSALLLWLLLVGSGCTRRVYVPVETMQVAHVRDSTHRVIFHHDSIFRLDSVRIERRGDTVYHTTVRDRYRLRRQTDTLCLTHTDTLYRNRTVTLPASEDKPSRRRSTTLNLLASLAALLVLAVTLRYLRGK